LFVNDVAAELVVSALNQVMFSFLYASYP
jgi:hypothetical protein